MSVYNTYANGKDSWKMIQDPGKKLDHHQNQSIDPHLTEEFHENPFINFGDIFITRYNYTQTET